MRRPALFSSPPSIAIADESLGDARRVAVLRATGLEMVPAWQARPPRHLRGLLATVPLLVAAVVAAFVIGRGEDARALRERPAAAVASGTAHGHALS